MTYTVIKTEIKGELVLTQVAYLINGKQYILDVFHSVFDLTEQGILDKLQEVGISEENKLNAIHAAEQLLANINL
jgi:hypothetical protein